MTAKVNGPSFMSESNTGSVKAGLCWEQNRQAIEMLLAAVAKYHAERDGDFLILLDGYLLGLCGHIRELLSKSGIEVKALPPTLGDELSKMLQ